MYNFSVLSYLYPLITILVVIIFILLIKILFHRKVSLPSYKKLRRRDTLIERWTLRKKKKEIQDSDDSKLFIRYRHSLFVFLSVAIFMLVLWSAWSIFATRNGGMKNFRAFFLFSGSLVSLQYVLSVLSVPYQYELAPTLNPVIIVPVFNEDPVALLEGVMSFFSQSVLPKEIHIVNDGSDDRIDYTSVKELLFEQGKSCSIYCTWTDQENQGKRIAQATAFQQIKETNDVIVVTVDSDGCLASNAIQEGLRPFTDEEVQSVAGLVVSKNVKQGLLSRFTEMIFVGYQQLVDRAALSFFGNVPVNSGGLAFYRHKIVSEAIEYNYTEEFFGKAHVMFSDDSYLTLFAILKGKAVNQPTATVFADMPVTLSHHIRQQVRWARGAFIRGFWRIHYTPVTSAVFWRQALGWINFFLVTCMLTQLTIYYVMKITLPPIEFFAIPIIFSYIQATRYFIVKRSDLSLLQACFIWLLNPFALYWSLIVLRIVRLYSMATCFKTGWGTREKVEISYELSKEDVGDLTITDGNDAS